MGGQRTKTAPGLASWMTAVAMLVAVAFSTQARAQEPQGDAAIPESEALIAATLSETDRMLVSVSIAGAGPYPFIVDTAAERSVISRELAAALQLPSAGRARLLSLTDTREVDRVSVPGVSFVPGVNRDLVAFALTGANIGAAGILGIDALRGQRVVLDFEAQTLRVGPAPQRPPRPGVGEIVVRGRPRLGQLVLVDVTVEGVPVDVVVDSGTQVSLGNEALQRLLVTRRNRFQQISLISVTGQSFAAQYTQADRLTLGDAVVTNMPVAFADAHFFRRMKLTRRPALLLGMDALQLFTRVTVDFPNRRAYFVLPEGARREYGRPTR